MLIAAVFAAGCVTTGRYERAVDDLSPGMSRAEVARSMPGTAKVETVPGAATIEILRYERCEAPGRCRSERLVFVEGGYVGRGIPVERFLAEDRLQSGLTRTDLGKAGLVPDLVRNSMSTQNDEVWGIRYRDVVWMERVLYIFFKEGVVENWVVAEARKLPPHAFEPGSEGFIDLITPLLLIPR